MNIGVSKNFLLSFLSEVLLVLTKLGCFVVRSPIRLDHPVLLIVGGCEFVAAQLHALELLGLPPVHLVRSHK